MLKYICLSLFILSTLNANSMCDFDKRWRSKSQELITASRKGDQDKVHRLLRAGADVNWINEYSYTPLISASLNGHTSIIKTLLSFDAKVDIANKYGYTPLMYASASGRIPIVSILLDKGAKTYLVDEGNQTALAYAEKFGRTAVADLIRWKGENGNRAAWITACVIVGRQAWPAGAGSASRIEIEE